MTEPGPVFVHIGLPKTGTTYLQTLLWGARDRLRDQGLLLPGFGPREHLWASGDVREEPRLDRRHDDAPGSWGRLADELGSWAGRGLITHEFLCGASADQAQRAVASLGAREVHVVVTARAAVELVTARWQEWVKNGSTGDIDDYPPDDGYRPADEWGWGTLDLGGVLQRWGSAVDPGRVHVICPPAAHEPRELMWQRFAGVIGVEPDVVDLAAERANESLGVVEVELLRRVNAALAARGGFTRAVDRGQWIRGYLAQEQLVAAGGPDGGERFWPSPARVAQLRAREDAGLEVLQAGGFDVVGDPATLRTPSELPPRRHPDEVTPAEQLDVAARLIAGLLDDVRRARTSRPGPTRGNSRADRPGGLREGVRSLRRLWHSETASTPRSTDG